ncbi:MAG: hypothetical protein M0P13_10565 [Fibrobacteraceae bacterium]|nr:hypothetical protein [Fibrobacteraceae bacterium]
MFIFIWSGKWFSPETADVVRTAIVVSVILAILLAFVVFVCLAMAVSWCQLQRHSLTTWENYQISLLSKTIYAYNELTAA